jgi:hypothetical protein
VAVPPQLGCSTRIGLVAAASVHQHGRLCDTSSRFYDKDSRLCNKPGRLCNKDGRLPINPFSNTCSRAQVVELANPQPNPSQINNRPAPGGGGVGDGPPHESSSRLDARFGLRPGFFAAASSSSGESWTLR